MKKTSTLLALGTALSIGSAQAEIEGEVHAGYNSDYVFRGSDLGGSNYEVGADIGGSLKCGIDWSLGVWYIDPDNGLEEVDLYGEISKDVAFGTLALGFVNYNYGNSGGVLDDDDNVIGVSEFKDDNEIYLSAATEFGGVGASLSLVYGFSGSGTFDETLYLEGGLSYGFDVNEQFTGELAVDAGFFLDKGDSKTVLDEGFAFFSVTLSGSYAITEQVSFNPYLSFTSGDSDVWGDIDFDGAHGGASVAVAF